VNEAWSCMITLRDEIKWVCRCEPLDSDYNDEEGIVASGYGGDCGNGVRVKLSNQGRQRGQARMPRI